MPCTPYIKGEHFTAIRWGDMMVFETYLPPSLDIGDFEEAINELEREIQQITNKPIFIAGDFNSKPDMWQSPVNDQRGRMIVEWASRLGLICLNQGGRSTCVRSTGESIVDLTFANPVAAQRVRSWIVSDGESKSNHKYIEMTISNTVLHNRRLRAPHPRRWAIKKMEEDLFTTAILVSDWPKTIQTEEVTSEEIEEQAEKLQRTLTEASDVAMPRSVPKPRKAMPWWNEELDTLRSNLTMNSDKLETLGKAIRKAKAKSWEEFVRSLNEDPWGRPYKVVLGKLRRWTPPYTESMDRETLDRVLTGLFPPGESDEWIEPQLPMEGVSSWSAELEVSHEEIMLAIKRMMEKNAAPGPSGIPAKA
ncbi:PREDICTED: uncharacterized protein LOC108764697 [Trachymyrmex cornetzi]|uniref:uncharacterized protein LOC108764697 n=1 Tax=Trachymyrmex cornetzi TaxID=471704 RepID=UPI00084F0404|nr:PREDICTED: uncharacterized protein LOC108764697 [Trachymyrmex cornetzi]